MTTASPLTASQVRLKELEAGGPVTSWFDPSIIDSNDPFVVAACGDRTTPCSHLLPPKNELDLIAIAAERVGLVGLVACCARASLRLYNLLYPKPGRQAARKAA